MTDEHIDEVMDLYGRRETVEKESYLASFEDIEKNDFNLNIPRYVDNFEEEEERETILDKVVLRKVYNKGFCFNTLDKKPELVRKTSGILCAGLAIYDAWLFLKKGKWLRKFGMVFLTAGAISNTYDRLIRGKVIDYIGIQWKNSRFRRLTANLADVYVVMGAAVTGVAKIFRR